MEVVFVKKAKKKLVYPYFTFDNDSEDKNNDDF